MRRATFALALALTAAIAGCIEDPRPLAPIPAFGVVSGQVLEAGLPVPATVRFLSLHGGWSRIELTARCDSTGRYRAELPPGWYEYEARIDDRTTPWSSNDTIQVGRGERCLDLVRGRARVTVRLPAAFDDRMATLSVRDDGWGADARITIEDGVAVFDMRLLEAGSYLLRFRPNSDHLEVYLPGAFTRFDADTLHVGTDGETTYESDLAARAITVTGRVSGTWQQIDRDMYVNAVDQWNRTCASTRCEDDGTYSLHVLAPGRLRFTAECANVESWFGGTGPATATTYDLGIGDTLAGLDHVEGGLRVRFVGPGLLADNSADLVIVHADGLRTYRTRTAMNPEPVVNLAPGTYRLFVHGLCTRRPWCEQWYDHAADEASATPVTVTAGAFTDVTVTLESGGSISGTLIPQYGLIDYGPLIRLHDADGEPVCAMEFWSEGGKFDIRGLADGDYCLSLGHNDRWWYPGTANLEEAVRLPVRGGRGPSGLTWPLPPESAKGTR